MLNVVGVKVFFFFGSLGGAFYQGRAVPFAEEDGITLGLQPFVEQINLG